MGATYQFTLDVTTNLRQKDDCYNEAIAGFLAGSAVGVASMCLWSMSKTGLTTDDMQGEAFRSCSVPEPLSPPS